MAKGERKRALRGRAGRMKGGRGSGRATAGHARLWGRHAVEAALKKRKHRPFFMVDIAVPRDIEPEVASLADVYLYTVDDLRQVIEENIRSREGAAREAENLVTDGVQAFLNQLRALDAVSTLKQFRQRAETLRDVETEKALRALRNGSDPETVLRSLARGSLWSRTRVRAS